MLNPCLQGALGKKFILIILRANSADGKLMVFVLSFSQKIGFYILCKLSLRSNLQDMSKPVFLELEICFYNNLSPTIYLAIQNAVVGKRHNSDELIHFYTSPHDSGRVLWFHVGRLCVSPSVRQSYIRQSIHFSFLDDNLSKRQWIFTKLGLCIDFVEIWFGNANGQILTELSARDTPIFSFPDDNLSKHQWIFTKLGTCIDMKEIWFGIAYGQILSIVDRVICPRHN